FIFSEQEHVCSFPKISLVELLRYTGKVAKVNFIAEQELLDFEVVFISHRARSSEELLKDLFSLLREYDLEATFDGGSYVIKKIDPDKNQQPHSSAEVTFHTHKLRYHSGEEIMPLLKQATGSLQMSIKSDALLKGAIASMQWVKTSNSLFYSSDDKTQERLTALIEKLDTPLKQVYVEVLVIETDLNKGGDYGVSWQNTPSADVLTACKDSLSQGLSSGIIGDVIVNGKKIFSELSSFVKYLNTTTKTSIVLNQKILARENKLSTIFEGDNIPFAGSVIELTGANERRTSNIQYKDIGVSLSIVPMISDSGVITLTIDEKITESHSHLIDNATNLSGIKTSKTQMTTEAHVPNDHFLALSGMTRKAKMRRKTGPPIISSIPLLGRLFTYEKEVEVKKSLIIFVRPHIVDNLNNSN
ncbi:hypothetical protein K0U07_03290, partial [bacterium]|nr:hypothetical protein [bacterium]